MSSEPPYRLCAIDLDDTLLGPSHELSERSVRAIQAARARGVIVVIASGRMNASTLRFAEQLGLDGPIISYNGAMVKNPATGEIWLEERIPADIAAGIMDFSRERSLQLNFYLNDLLYSAAWTSWLQLYYSRTLSPVVIKTDMVDTLRGESPTKLIIVDSPETTNALLEQFRASLGAQLYVTKSNIEYLEFMPPQASKGAALACVAAKYGIAPEQTIAFGDSWNDIPMLQWAGLGIAVRNAKPEVLQAADRIVGRSDEDGVAVALEEIFGLEEPTKG